MFHDYSEAAAPYFDNPRPDMLGFVPAGVARVLEVGCGSGAFGATIKARCGAAVVGVEFIAEAAAIARSRLDAVHVCDLQRELPPLAPASFDCLVCNDVLEHLPDPWTVLGRLREFVAPGGWLVASIPNVRHHKVVRRLVWPGAWTYENGGVLDRTHLRFFTRASARELIEQAGFEVVREEGLHRGRFPVWMRLLEALTGDALEDMHYLQYAFVARRRA